MRPIVAGILGLFAMLPAVADTGTAPNIRVCVQFVEMPHTAMTELLSGKAQSGQALHDKAMAMTREGKAKILESCVVSTRSGQRSTIESVRELIYPIELESPTDHQGNPIISFYMQSHMPRPLMTCPTAYDKRNTGSTLTVTPTINSHKNMLDVCIQSTYASVLELKTIAEYHDNHGNASVRMPTFETWQTNTSLALQVDKFELASTITPRPTEAVPATLRKILVFVRCDVVPVGSSR